MAYPSAENRPLPLRLTSFAHMTDLICSIITFHAASKREDIITSWEKTQSERISIT